MANGMTKAQADSLLQSLKDLEKAVKEDGGNDAVLAEMSNRIATMEKTVHVLNVTVLTGNSHPSLKAQVEALSNKIKESNWKSNPLVVSVLTGVIMLLFQAAKAKLLP